MTTSTARGLTSIELERRGVHYLKMVAKKVSFEDLARDSKIFVTIHFERRPMAGLYDSLKAFAQREGFIIQFYFPGCIN
jgi:hypothetical protein